MHSSQNTIKWIVSDMDGTMLNRNHEISEETKRGLMECQKRGIKLIMASGRAHSRMLRYAAELRMADYHGYFIEVNGMAIMDVKTRNRRIFERLRYHDIARLFREIKKNDMEFQGYEDAAIYNYIPPALMEDKRRYREEMKLPDDYPWTSGDWHMVLDLRDGYKETFNIESEEELPDQLNKVAACHHPEVIDRYVDTFNTMFQSQYEVTKTTPRCLEFAPKGVSKGVALRKLMKEYGIAKDEVLVFGDGENDISMFGEVVHSVAMGNAPQTVKDAASEVTLGNHQDGIVATLKQYGLI